MKILPNGWLYPDSGAERLYDLRDDEGKLLAIGNRVEIWVAKRHICCDMDRTARLSVAVRDSVRD